jgi:hypothetical protein
MKTLTSLLSVTTLIAIVIISISNFTGCKNNVESENIPTYQAYSERDFIRNSNLRAEPGGIIITDLEPNGANLDTLPDTYTLGEDIIPIRYTENAVHTVRIQDYPRFTVSLYGAEFGEFIYELSPAIPVVTMNIPAGDYYFHIRSTINNDTNNTPHQTIFIRPNTAAQVRVNGNYEPSQTNTLITSYDCGKCNLDHANLYKLNLSAVYFGEANMEFTNLNYTNLAGANLDGAKLRSADIRYSYLWNVHMIGSSLTSAVFYQSDLTSASVIGTNLTYANLNNCNLSYSDFTNSDISFADLCGSNKTGMISNGIIYNPQTLCWP